MGKREMATNLFNRLLVTTIFIVLLSGTSHSLSDKRLCADENCKEIISMGSGKLNYPAGSEGMVSFRMNSLIRIKSKSAGKDPSLWGIEVNGREGYAPKELIRENKVFISEKDLKFVVDVKPVVEQPILSSSENLITKIESVESTTTKPLENIPKESVEMPLPTAANEVTKIESTTIATPVIMELVDGTQIPKIDYDLDGMGESVENGGIVNTNQKEDINSDGENINEDQTGDYDDEEEEEDDYQPNLKLDKSNEAKLEENMLPKYIDTEIKENGEQEDVIEVIEKLEGAVTSNHNFVNNQSSLETSGDNESKDINNTLTEEKMVLENSTMGSNKTENQKQILENVPDEKQREAMLNRFERNESQNSINEYNTEKEAKEENTNIVTDDKKTLPTEVEAIREINKENGNKAEKDSTRANEQLIVNLFTDPNQSNHLLDNNLHKEGEQANKDLKKSKESNTENFDNNPQLNKTFSIENTGDSESKGDLTKAIDNLENSLESSNNVVDSYTSLRDSPLIINDFNEIDNSSKQNEISTVADTYNAHNSNEFESNIKHIVSTERTEEQKTILTATISPQIVMDKSINQIDNQKEEDNPQAKKDISITETSPNVRLSPSQDNNNEYLHIPSLTTEVPHNSFYEHQATYYDNAVHENSHNNNNPVPNSHLAEEAVTVEYTSAESLLSDTNTDFKKYEDSSVTEASTNVHLPLPQDNNNEELHMPSQTTEVPYNSFYEHQATYYDDAVHENSHNNKNPVSNSHLVEQAVTVGYTSAEPLLSDTNTDFRQLEDRQTLSPSTPKENTDTKDNKGLFATIMGTVNSVLSINKKIKNNENEDNQELDRILYSNAGGENIIKTRKEEGLQYCKQIGPNGDCPHQSNEVKTPVAHCDCSIIDTVFSSDLTFDAFIKALAAKVLEISEVLVFLVIVAAASLFFIFGYYCFCNSSREGALLSKLNQLESSLLASQKENAILMHNLMSTRQKLTSIEDNSFGSNDMVVSLKKDLEEELLEKARLQDQISALQKELENAADAGIELNKIVSELLSNQTGDESIISSVEELQKQLNEQQNTILEINASLAEKSRENSELQLLLAEQIAKYESELAILQRDNDELEHEKGILLSRLEELKNDFDRDITTALEGKNIEIKRLQSDILELNNKVEGEHTKWQTSLAKVEALEECLKNLRKDPSVNIAELIDVASVKAQLIELQRKYKTIKERYESEIDSRKLAENQLQIVSAELEKLKQDFNQSEKDKLEAQTRLEVLSNYFKEKENQLQKELSLKEAMWLKQQGETTTTVDRLTAMQEEIQSLKSQNDSLRAEIEAQVAAHKAQTGTLENRAHETWLAARQSDRRYEEARAEATALRRKLTALAGGNINEGNKSSAGPITLSENLTNVPSPIHMESPGSPMLGRLPPPPFLPPPFMGPPPPFIGMPPPPPFVPPGEMRPAPLGRIMSPPPQRSGRFSPQHLDYEDYLEYEDNNTWHRQTYSPPPRTYRSLSPTDSRYDYGTERDLMSTYDTETDFSPPPSPRESRRRGGNVSEKSDLLKNSNNGKRFNNNKGPLSSGSEKSYNSPSHSDTKAKQGSTSGKSIV